MHAILKREARVPTLVDRTPLVVIVAAATVGVVGVSFVLSIVPMLYLVAAVVAYVLIGAIVCGAAGANQLRIPDNEPQNLRDPEDATRLGTARDLLGLEAKEH